MPRTDISQRASSTARESSVPARDTQENSGTSDVFDCETNYATASPPPIFHSSLPTQGPSSSRRLSRGTSSSSQLSSSQPSSSQLFSSQPSSSQPSSSQPSSSQPSSSQPSSGPKRLHSSPQECSSPLPLSQNKVAPPGYSISGKRQTYEGRNHNLPAKRSRGHNGTSWALRPADIELEKMRKLKDFFDSLLPTDRGCIPCRVSFDPNELELDDTRTRHVMRDCPKTSYRFATSIEYKKWKKNLRVPGGHCFLCFEPQGTWPFDHEKNVKGNRCGSFEDVAAPILFVTWHYCATEFIHEVLLYFGEDALQLCTDGNTYGKWLMLRQPSNKFPNYLHLLYEVLWRRGLIG